MCACVCQLRKTLDATMQTLQDMLTVEDFDVSEAFQHSQSTESVKSASSDSYMSKANISKRRANQQETEGFYFTVSPHTTLQRRRQATVRTDASFLSPLVLLVPPEIQGILEWKQPHCQTGGQA